ncbi:MAG TPA: DUF1015 domain-containing protein [Fimbriimonas sp.]|nr:DUF1015 domain-containing protein [Fimbriimonas sp.]
MAVIRPFRGLRYTAEAGPIDALTAPPYDVLTPAQRDEYAVRNKHNVVYLTLPESEPDDRSKYIKYARSKARLEEWRRDGSLVAESRPALYRYTQNFSAHRPEHNYTRTAIIALIKVEPYANGVVLPHEETFPKHKEDRLRILEATRTHLECIFGLYEDPAGEILKTINAAPAAERVETRSDEGVSHVLEPITDEATINQLVNLMADKKVWIADGHHRYETALAFREALGPRDGPVAEDYMMMALTSMSDPGLVLHPTHRVLRSSALGRTTILERLANLFHIHETHSTRVMEMLEAERRQGRRALGAVFEGGLGYVLTPKDDASLLGLINTDDSQALKSLDVSVLHRVMLEQALGVQSLDDITYTRDYQEAIRMADEGAAVSFLMTPPTVDDMKEIALNGEKMPQKSTYYFPKILSGLVIWSLNDF